MVPVSSDMLVRAKPLKKYATDASSQRRVRVAKAGSLDIPYPASEKCVGMDCVECRLAPVEMKDQNPDHREAGKRDLDSWRRRLSACHLLRVAIPMVCALVSAAICPIWSQATAGASVADGNPRVIASHQKSSDQEPPANSSAEWGGLTVRSIAYHGVSAERLAPLSGHLPQAEGAPLSGEKLKASLRQLYATGLYDTIEVAGNADQGGVDLIFRGTPATFIGTVSVDGATGATMNTQLERACQLEPGTRLTQAKMIRATQQMRATLEQNGYHESAIAQSVTRQPDQQLANIAFRVVSGARARVGKITSTGDSGMNLDEFREEAHLRTGASVDHDTVNRALEGVLKHFQSQNRLEADVKLEAAEYDEAAKAMDYRFSVNRGPVVKVTIEGASIDSERLKHLIPIFEEGSVDDDLLNEGNRRLRDTFQRRGYFDVKVDHSVQSVGKQEVTIQYTVQLGTRRSVRKVAIEGNHYFGTPTLMDLLSVHASDVLDRQGLYSQSLVSADVSALEALSTKTTALRR